MFPPSNGMRVSNRFLTSGDNEVGQNVNLTNISVTQESKRYIISVLGNDSIGSFIHTIKEET